LRIASKYSLAYSIPFIGKFQERQMQGQNFEIGDTVRLRSGGPLMTVHDIGDYGTHLNPGLLCIWFDGAKRMQEVFHPKAVELDHN
jgi:uncharacterized protein YodC (DUF2158 family)